MGRNVRVGIVGVGNNASALIQGVTHYGRLEAAGQSLEGTDGVRFPVLCGITVGAVEFSVAFDVDTRKIGRDLGTAIFAAPNCYPRLVTDIHDLGVEVQECPVLDGVPEHLGGTVSVTPGQAGVSLSAADRQIALKQVAEAIRDSRTDVLLNLLPSGSNDATLFFGEAAVEGGASVVNCTPSPLVHSDLRSLFESRRQVVLGDDLESQFGSSLTHRALLTAMAQRGLTLKYSYQMNVGGNTDFANLAVRGEEKKRSKLKAATGEPGMVDILPSAGVLPGLEDYKVGYFFIEGTGWLGTPITIDVKLRVQDSSNAAGVIIDAVRLAAAARASGHVGYLPASFYFKNPLGEKVQTKDALAEILRYNEKFSWQL